MKRSLAILLAIFVVLIMGSWLYLRSFPEKVIERVIPGLVQESNLPSELLLDTEKIHVFTIGTSSPLISQRNNTCNAIFINGHFFLFDVGDGGIQLMETMQLPLKAVEAVFITHYHSDHFIDLPNLINRSWLLGRNHPLDVYGPGGTDTIVQAINTMLHIENQHRVNHHGSDIMNATYGIGVPHQFHVENDSSAIIYNQDGISITAFDVNHEPVTPDVGYRIEYKGKVVVISGDTNGSALSVQYLKNADLLIHEVQANEIVKLILAENIKLGNERNAKIISDILDYHTSISDVLKIGKLANPKKLVLSHFTPPPDNIILENYYEKAIRGYEGEIVLAKDGDHYIID